MNTDHHACTSPTKHSILDEGALVERVLSQYPLRGPVRCRLYRRSMSDAYLVEAGDEAFFFKVGLYGRHTRSEVESEIEFANDLCKSGIAVAPLVQRCDGAYLCELDAPEGTRYGLLYRAAVGQEPEETNLEHSRLFGRLAAQIHNCADQLDRTYDRWQLDEAYLIRDPIRGMEPYLEHRPADLDYLNRFGEELIAELQGLLCKDRPVYGLCHGDLHAGNARLDQDGELVLFDLDSFGYGWRALDIGVYRVSYDWLNLSRACKVEKDRFWAAFLEGYHEERTLSQRELAAVGLSLPVRHLELMGLTMRYWAQHQGIHWITDEYFDHHVAWFKEWAGEYRHY
jgi:Ser/Thr protein kinase RdoA (MazF antagonist)